MAKRVRPLILPSVLPAVLLAARFRSLVRILLTTSIHGFPSLDEPKKNSRPEAPRNTSQDIIDAGAVVETSKNGLAVETSKNGLARVFSMSSMTGPSAYGSNMAFQDLFDDAEENQDETSRQRLFKIDVHENSQEALLVLSTRLRAMAHRLEVVEAQNLLLKEENQELRNAQKP